MTTKPSTRDAAAEKYATHDKDCTCKGNHFDQEKYDSFLAGAAHERARSQKLIDALKLIQDDNRLMNAMKKEQVRAIMDSLAAYEAGKE